MHGSDRASLSSQLMSLAAGDLGDHHNAFTEKKMTTSDRWLKVCLE
jgi:hypothetical protein